MEVGMLKAWQVCVALSFLIGIVPYTFAEGAR